MQSVIFISFDFILCVLTSKCRSSILSLQPEFGQRTVRDRISLLAKLSGNSWSLDNISLSTGHLCPVSLFRKRRNSKLLSAIVTIMKMNSFHFILLRQFIKGRPFVNTLSLLLILNRMLLMLIDMLCRSRQMQSSQI